MPKVIHFEIHADDPERASSFYGSVFGWHIQKWEGPEDYWLANTGGEGEPGIDGAIMGRLDPGTAGINYIGVDSVDDYIQKAVASGGRVIKPKVAIPGMGYAAVCADTEGNPFGLYQGDPSAS